MSTPAPHTPGPATPAASPLTPAVTSAPQPQTAVVSQHDDAAAGTASINGAPVPVREGFTLTDAVADLTGREITPRGTATDGHPLGIAVAVDNTVVPRSLWATTAVAPGQSVEIVTAVQGG